MMQQRVKPARASLEIDGTMTHQQITDALAKMIFTSAKNWTRTVRMDKTVRDLIVKAFRFSYKVN